MCKINKLNEDSIHIDKERSISFTGITTEKIKSIGTSELNFTINNFTEQYKFHIVDEEFPIPTDGILGRDFFSRFLCKIDYETFTITLTLGNEEITVPMKSWINKNYCMKVERRSESIHPKNLDICEDSIILNKEIKSGIFVSNTIVPGKGNHHVKILNTTDNDIILENIDFEIEPLRNYTIVQSTHRPRETNFSKDRFSKLIDTIKMDVKDEKARTELIQIFKDYEDIFHLKGETLTSNNFYTQNLKISDNTPVYIKNYRLPHTQHDEINDQVQQLLDEAIIEPSTSAYNSPLLVVPK